MVLVAALAGVGGLAVGPAIHAVAARFDAAAPSARRRVGLALLTSAAFVGVAVLVVSESTLPAAATAGVLVAYLYFGALAIALTIVDLRTHRLPNALVLPSYAVAFGLFAAACLLGASWAGLLRAAVGCAVLWGIFLCVRLLQPRGLGGGDVKLAGVIGAYLAWIGWGPFAVGVLAAFVFGGLFGIVMIAVGRAGPKTAIAFGPWMLAGAWAGIVWGEATVGVSAALGPVA